MAMDPQADQDAFSQQYDAQQTAKASQEAQQTAEPSFLQKWVLGPGTRIGTQALDTAVSAADSMFQSADSEGSPAKPVIDKARDVMAGGATAIGNGIDATRSAIATGTKSMLDTIVPGASSNPAFDALQPAKSPVWDNAKNATLNFRDAVQLKDPGISDNLTQSVAQLAVPFMGFSRAFSEVHGFANTVAAGIATDTTALGPHDMRMADLLSLGQHTEGKLGDALRAAGPYGLNTYINYLTDRGDETEAQGRFKNALDGLVGNAILTPVLHAAGVTLKAGMNAGSFMKANGIGSLFEMGPLAGSPAAQRGAVGYHGTPHDPDFFDNTKIGTGEGAQLYGYGHYIAENPDTAEHYATTLNANGGASAALRLARSTLSSSDDARSAVTKLNAMADDADHPNDKAHYQAAAALIKSGNAKAGGGNVIRVHMDDDHVASMMDWDKPMSEQPGVAAKLGPAAGASMTGKDVHRALEKIGMTKQQIAEEMGAAGIPGIKYLDAGSRTEGEGTRNYVMFDGKNLRVTGKSKGK